MVKNFIFDLGGVILDLDVPKALSEFSKLSGVPIDRVTQLFKSSDGFILFEKGELGEKEFRDFVRNLYSINASDVAIDKCWNAMLLSIPSDRLELLSKLKKQFRTFLLSNTNAIHFDFINLNLLPSQNEGHSLNDYFHKAHYSHLMKKRKPDAEIFIQVLDENGLIASETLFFDDNADNIEGAKKVGLQTAFVNTNNFLIDYFHEQRTA